MRRYRIELKTCFHRDVATLKCPDMLVLSRDAAAAYEPALPTEVCISITDPHGTVAALSPAFADVLRLAFSDIASPSPFSYDVLFGEEHRNAIVEFFDRWRDADRIVIHCVGGRSRSPAVAMGLFDRLGVSASDWEERYPLWNTWVRSELGRTT